MSTLRIEDVVRTYVTKRDNLRALKSANEIAESAIKAELKKMEAWLLRETDRAGVEGFKTPYGTVYKTIQAAASVEDWDRVLDFIREKGEYALLARGVNKTVVKDLITRGGATPPGIRYVETRGISVRKI